MRQVSPALKQSNVLRRCAPLRVKQSSVGRRSGSCFRRAAVDRGPVPPSVPALCLDLSLCYSWYTVPQGNTVPQGEVLAKHSTVHCATGKGPQYQYSVTPGTPAGVHCAGTGKGIGTAQRRESRLLLVLAKLKLGQACKITKSRKP